MKTYSAEQQVARLNDLFLEWEPADLPLPDGQAAAGKIGAAVRGSATRWEVRT